VTAIFFEALKRKKGMHRAIRTEGQGQGKNQDIRPCSKKGNTKGEKKGELQGPGVPNRKERLV